MDKKIKESIIQINNETYEQIALVRFAVNELKIKHNLGSSDGVRYEELKGDGEILNYAKLTIISSDGSRSLSQNKINLSISKGDDIKHSALLNLKNYLGEIENIEDYGLNECVNAGFSHLTYSESIYDYDRKIECTLILADDVYDILLAQVKSQVISKLMFAVNYFNLFNKVKSISEKELYEFGNEEAKVYIFAEDSGVELIASTFGSVETFLVYTHKNTLIEKIDKTVNENDELKEYEQNILNHMATIRIIIVRGLFVIILLLIINALLIS